MSHKPSLPPSKMPHVGTTIFTEMTALAQAHGALNVAQGFPDLATPKALRQAAAAAMEDGHNQYAPMPGNHALGRGSRKCTTPGRDTVPTRKSRWAQARPACCTPP